MICPTIRNREKQS